MSGELRISQLPAASSLADTDDIPVVQGVGTRATRRATAAVIREAAQRLPATLTGGVDRTVAAKLGDVVSVKDFGATTGGVNATSAFLAALTYAAGSPGTTITIPAGTFTLSSVTSAGLVLPPKTTIRGAGRDATTLVWNDDSGLSLFRGPSSGRYASIVLEDFGIVGTQDTRGNAEVYPIVLRNYDGVVIRRVRVEKSRAMAMAIRTSTDVTVQDCDVRYCGRDGINAAQCTRVSILDNRISWCDDDAIAVHSSVGQPETNNNELVISGNRIFLAQGIKVLGARHAVISDNVIDCVMAQGINVRTSEPTGTEIEGVAAGIAISITGNVVTNILDRTAVDNLNQNNPFIIVNGKSARAGSAAAVPGDNDTVSGAVVDYYGNLNANSSSTSTPTPGSYQVLIANNICGRTLKGGAAFSTYGRGQVFARGGWYDPVFTEAQLGGYGVRFTGGHLKSVLVTGNVFFGMQTGIEVTDAVVLDDVHIRGNQFWDVRTGFLNSGVGADARMRVYIEDNTFDLDPLVRHANRGANGTWQAEGAPIAMAFGAGKGFVVNRNLIRNACLDSDINTANPANDQASFHDNIVECDPSVISTFSTSNKGVGLVRQPVGMLFRHVDCDPASATFGKILTHEVRTALAMPTSGKFIAGTFVRSAATTVASGKMVLGWYRLTTGTGHVAGTDWQAVYGTTS